MNQQVLDKLTDLYGRLTELTEDFDAVLSEVEYETTLDENVEEELINQDYD